MFSMKRTTAALLAGIAIAAAPAIPAASAHPAGPDSGSGSAGVAARGLDDMHNVAVQQAAGTLNAPDNAVVKVPAQAPSADTGIDWAGIGIGAGLAALLLAGAGVMLVRRPARMRLH
jgi:hypothetical protein